VLDSAGSEDELLEMARSLASDFGVDPKRVSVRTVPVSRADAMQSYSQLRDLLSKVDNLVATISFDAPTATFHLSVPSSEALVDRPDLASAASVANVEAFVRDFDSEVATSVSVGTTDAIPESMTCDPDAAGWMEAGRAFRFNVDSHTHGCNPGGETAFCTTNFAVTRFGNQGVLTASHCNGYGELRSEWATIMYANEDNDFVATRPYVSTTSRNQWADVQMNREVYAAATLRNKVYLYDQNWVTITSFVHEHPNGTSVCLKGARTAMELASHFDGYMCGSITNNVSAPNWWQNPFAWAEVNLDWHPNARRGDSGGPVYSQHIARGILTDGIQGTGTIWYNKIAFALDQLDATLVTD
jgi:hypothetical protein